MTEQNGRVNTGEQILATLQRIEALLIKGFSKNQRLTARSSEAVAVKLPISTTLGGLGGFSLDAPITSPRHRKAAALDVLAKLNEVAGTKHRGVPANVRLVSGRLRDGATVRQCYAVIGRKVREWQGTDMERYLRPATLFNATKFTQYLGEIPAGEHERLPERSKVIEATAVIARKETP